jgi:hypothetical protein
MMPWSGLLPINSAQVHEMGTSLLHSNQARVGGHRADRGAKHAAGVISGKARSESKTAETDALAATADMRLPSHAERRLTAAALLPTF